MRTTILILALAGAAVRGAAGPQASAPSRLTVLLLEPGAAPLQCTPPAGSNATLLSLVARHSGGQPSAEQHAEYAIESIERTIVSGDATQLTALATVQASASALSTLPDSGVRASAVPARGADADELVLGGSGEPWADDDFYSQQGGRAPPRRLQGVPAALPRSLREEEPAMWVVLMVMAVLAAVVSQLVSTPVLWFGRSASAKYDDEGLVTGEGGEGAAYVATAQVSVGLLQLAMLIQLGEPSGGAASAGCAASSWFGHVGGAAIMAALLAKLLHLARVGDASELRVRLSDRRVSSEWVSCEEKVQRPRGHGLGPPAYGPGSAYQHIPAAAADRLIWPRPRALPPRRSSLPWPSTPASPPSSCCSALPSRPKASPPPRPHPTESRAPCAAAMTRGCGW